MSSHLHVVLTDDVYNLGKSGELARVRPGYARNFLIPRSLAVLASKDNVARIEHDKRVAEAKASKLRGEAQALAAKLGALKLTIEHQAGDEDKLYGSVTTRDVEDLLAKAGYAVDRRRIMMDPIKKAGVFPVSVRLATDIAATIELTVVGKA